jgi:DNA primase
MSNIIEAKRRLPLPVLMNQLGLGDHARKSARCPFHEDHRNSFSVFQGERGWFFKCHAGCGVGDEINLLEKHKNISRSQATKLYLKMAE